MHYPCSSRSRHDCAARYLSYPMQDASKAIDSTHISDIKHVAIRETEKSDMTFDYEIVVGLASPCGPHSRRQMDLVDGKPVVIQFDTKPEVPAPRRLFYQLNLLADDVVVHSTQAGHGADRHGRSDGGLRCPHQRNVDRRRP